MPPATAGSLAEATAGSLVEIIAQHTVEALCKSEGRRRVQSVAWYTPPALASRSISCVRKA